ncbi:MAG TPA: alpha/beta hydrolase [Caulobacteraceae bacterium]|nr:alpha/beta hydrolase [Caulobacteraceae bacterium]
MLRLLASLIVGALIALSSQASAAERWLTRPAPPPMPKPVHTGYAHVNGIDLWYAEYGKGPPVILLHGGLANSEYWGNQVPALARAHRVITVDSRGHGHSTRDAQPYSYDLMADDVVALMDKLRIRKAAIVGWSDGAILGLDLAIRRPERLTRVFAFGANSDPSGVKFDALQSSLFGDFMQRAGDDYRRLSRTPGEYDAFLAAVNKMWETEPHFTEAQLRAIKTPMAIVDGDHDEVIKREHTDWLASVIPGAKLIILPQASHFAMLQDSKTFNKEMLGFLDGR